MLKAKTFTFQQQKKRAFSLSLQLSKVLCPMPIFFLFLLLFFSACRPDAPLPQEQGLYSAGLFAINEGIFGQSSGTISYYNPKTGENQADVFYLANSRYLGDVVQSLCFQQEQAYIVVNNSNKIEIANRKNFKEEGQILDIPLPRYMHWYNDSMAVISLWGSDGLSGELAFYSREQARIVKRLALHKGPERIYSTERHIYVLHEGGYDKENKIARIDKASQELAQSIELDENPNSLLIQAGETRAWLLCKGSTVYTNNYPEIDSTASYPASLILLELPSGQVLQRRILGLGKNARQLCQSPDRHWLYFLQNGGIFRLPSENIEAEAELFMPGNFYGLGIQEQEELLYAARYDFLQRSSCLRLNAQGEVQDSFLSGVFTNGFYFLD